MTKLLFTVICGLLALQTQAGPVKIAVSLDPPQDNNAAVIAPTVEELEKAFAKEGLEVVPLKLPALEKALQAKEFDIFLSTSGLARRMAKHGARDLVTLVSDRFPDPNKAYGSVFVVRKDSPYQTLADLKNRRLVSNMPGGFYGYQIAMGELQKQGFSPETHFKSTEFVGRDLHHVIDAVLAGKADVGTLSSCFLEDAYAPDSFERQNLRAIGLKSNGPCLCSTELYPNWSVSSTPNTPAEISRRATLALLSMPATTGGLRWSIATDFNPTDDLFRDLRVGSFEFLRGYFRTEFMRHYGLWLLAGIVAVLFLTLFCITLAWLVRRRTEALSQALQTETQLKNEVRETGDKLLAMQKISLIGQLSSMIAHELRQPLMTIQAYVHGCSKFVRDQNINQEELLDILSKINRQVVKADALVERVRAYAKNKEVRKIAFDLKSTVQKTCRRFQESGRYNGQLVLSLCKTPVTVAGVSQEIELAVTNILKNASEALESIPAKKRKISIDLSCDDALAYLRISDNGPKLSEHSLRALHVPLNSSKIEGLGLGLSIVSSIIDNHEGKMTIVESPQGGVSVQIVLPLQKE